MQDLKKARTESGVMVWTPEAVMKFFTSAVLTNTTVRVPLTWNLRDAQRPRSAETDSCLHAMPKQAGRSSSVVCSNGKYDPACIKVFYGSQWQPRLHKLSIARK